MQNENFAIPVVILSVVLFLITLILPIIHFTKRGTKPWKVVVWLLMLVATGFFAIVTVSLLVLLPGLKH